MSDTYAKLQARFPDRANPTSIAGLALLIAARGIDEGVPSDPDERALAMGGITFDVVRETNAPLVPGTPDAGILIAITNAMLDCLLTEAA